MANKKKATVRPKQDKIFWRFHDSGQARVRIWRETWSFDQFEIIKRDEFEMFLMLASKLGITVREMEDEDND